MKAEEKLESSKNKEAYDLVDNKIMFSSQIKIKDDSLHSVLDSVDREIQFYRKRAGQVFFIGILVEVLILAGREKIVVPTKWPWLDSFIYSIFFVAVAIIGIALGSEYMNRIHKLKDSRNNLFEKLGITNIYTKIGGARLSEIEVLYVVLTFLSSGGIIITWLNESSDHGFNFLFWFNIILGFLGLLYVLCKLVVWILFKR